MTMALLLYMQPVSAMNEAYIRTMFVSSVGVLPYALPIAAGVLCGVASSGTRDCNRKSNHQGLQSEEYEEMVRLCGPPSDFAKPPSETGDRDESTDDKEGPANNPNNPTMTTATATPSQSEDARWGFLAEGIRQCKKCNIICDNRQKINHVCISYAEMEQLCGLTSDFAKPPNKSGDRDGMRSTDEKEGPDPACKTPPAKKAKSHPAPRTSCQGDTTDTSDDQDDNSDEGSCYTDREDDRDPTAVPIKERKSKPPSRVLAPGRLDRNEDISDANWTVVACGPTLPGHVMIANTKTKESHCVPKCRAKKAMLLLDDDNITDLTNPNKGFCECTRRCYNQLNRQDIISIRKTVAGLANEEAVMDYLVKSIRRDDGLKFKGNTVCRRYYHSVHDN